jgi:cyclic-di-GMP-binding protein
MKSVFNVLNFKRKEDGSPEGVPEEELPAGRSTEPPLSGVTDARRCAEWLGTLPRTNTQQVTQAIAALLETLDGAALFPLQNLEILETLRHTLAYSQDENAIKYRFKPLPFGVQERAMFEHVTGLWQMMHQAYANALHAAADPACETNPHFALICQRAISYTTLSMREFVLARQQVPRMLWNQLHTYFEIAFASNIADTKVRDSEAASAPHSSSHEAYVQALLFDLAQPYSLKSRDSQLAFVFAGKWAKKVELIPQAGGGEGGAESGLHVNLASDRGANRKSPKQDGQVLKLNRSALSKFLRKRVMLLDEGASTGDTELDDMPKSVAMEMLSVLHRNWCESGNDRVYQRRPGAAFVELCSGFEAMHYFVSGNVFVQPSHVRASSKYSHRDHEEMHTFRDMVVPPQQASGASSIGLYTESWSVLDQAPTGFRLERRGHGARFSQHQLTSVRPKDAPNYLLCEVCWLMETDDGALQMGLQALPGVPHALAIRSGGQKTSISEAYTRAFIMPSNPTIGAVSSLVLPTGWYQADRVIEIYSEGMGTVRLIELLERGVDYDRVSFQLLNAG